MTWRQLLGAELKNQAKARGLRARDVAELMGKTPQWVSLLNNGKSKGVDVYEDYARAIGVEAGELFEYVSKRAKIKQASKEVEA